MMRKLMKIELKSDLCSGVGKHYAAVLNLDTALDEYGLPYIPSRRLKGCMREAAELIKIPDLEKIFGVRGKSESGSLKISNAVIENYNETIKSLRENNIFHSEVTDLFCYTRQETAIESETDTAKDQSLRFIRVVNRDYPDSSDPMCFYAPVSFDDNDYKKINDICKALRNIGYHRNRGLGAVECSLIDYPDKEFYVDYPFEDDKEYELRYGVYLDGDMMLPASDSSHTLDYIPGTSVLGALAAKYKGENFEQLFLSENVRFGNLYISDSRQNSFYPAPRFLAKIKAAKDEDQGIKNTIGVKLETCDKSAPTKQYKTLKKEYINKTIGHKEPKQKIVYHNNIKDEDGGLYMQYCICSGQYFKGTITAKGRYLKEICPLLSDGVLYLGRSKTAQYAACRLLKLPKEEMIEEVNIKPFTAKCDSVVSVNHKSDSSARKTFTAKPGSVVAFVLQSDVILTNENGVYTAEASALLNCFKNDNLIFDEIDSDVTDKTSIAVKIISGYNAKWNLKKPQITAFAAGSAIIARVKNNEELPKHMLIGEKQNEGYGVIEVIENADQYAVTESKTKDDEKTQCDLLSLIYKRRRRDELLDLAVKKANKIDFEEEKLNSTQISRVLLMSKQANSLENFDERLESIKNDNIRIALQKYFNSKAIHTEIGEENEWEQERQYLIDCLYACKYILKRKEKSK